MRKNLKVLFMFLAVFCFCGLFSPKQVQAAKSYTLKANVNYTLKNMDITGDKKDDKLVILSKYDSSKGRYKITVGVNQKAALIIYPNKSRTPSIKLFSLDNGLKYLYLSGTSGSTQEYSRLYFYKNNKFVRALDLRSIVNNTYFKSYSVAPQYVSKNNIAFKLKTNSYTVGNVEWLETFTFSAGKAVRQIKTRPVLTSSNNGKAITRTAKRSFYLKKTAGSTKNSAIVYKNDTVKISSIYVKNKKVYYKITKSDGKSGWIPSMTYSTWKNLGSDRTGYFFKNLSL